MKIKKLLGVILCAMVALCVLSVVAFANGNLAELVPAYDWYDSEASVYEIDSIEDLAGLGKLTQNNVTLDDGTTLAKTDFANKTVNLTADLTFEGNEYWYFNDGSVELDYQIRNFAGEFNGNNNTIKNLKFFNSSSKNPSVGLFGTVTGTLCDLNLEEVTATLNTSDKFGFFANTLNGGTAYDLTLNKVSVAFAGYTSVSGSMFGSISSASVTYCSAEKIRITFTGTDNTDMFSGFIGSAGGTKEAPSTIENCSLTDAVLTCDRKTKRTGGFIGNTSYTDVSSCTVTDLQFTIGTYYQNVGGFVGVPSTSSHFTDCSVINPVMNGYSSDYAGNLGGFASYSSGSDVSFIRCSVIDLTMIAEEVKGYAAFYAGGFISEAYGSTVFEDCYVSGTIDATNVAAYLPVGGFTGSIGNGGGTTVTMTGCVADVDIIASGVAGGFVGTTSDYKAVDTIILTDCKSNGNVTSLNGAAGGFVATANNGTFEKCEANGSVSGDVAGGFVAEITPNTSTAVDKTVTINNSTAAGPVLGSTTAGGFVAQLTTSQENYANATTVTITNSTAAETVAGANSNSEVFEFANEIIPEGSTSCFVSEGNTAADVTITVKSEDKTLTLDENGNVVVPAGSTVVVGGNEVYLEDGGNVTGLVFLTVDPGIGTVLDANGNAMSGVSHYPNGQVITLTAQVIDGYTFSGWDIAGATVEDREGKSITFTMTEDVYVTAVYRRTTSEIVPGGNVVYTVEYYLDGEVYETEYLLGAIGSEVTAEIKTFEGYLYLAEQSTVSGTVVTITNPEDIVTLKLYYRSVHTFNAPVYEWAVDGKSCTVIVSCSKCEMVESFVIAEGDAEFSSVVATPATCAHWGTTKYTVVGVYTAENGDTCSYESSKSFVDIRALTHTEVFDAAVEAGCTTAGLTEGKHCGECGIVIVAQHIVPDKHTSGECEIVVKGAVEATYDAEGYTGDKHCKDCDALIESGEVIAKLENSGESEEPDTSKCGNCICHNDNEFIKFIYEFIVRLLWKLFNIHEVCGCGVAHW